MAELLERTPYYAFCSFHSAGNCIYWIDSSNSPALREKLAQRFPDVQFRVSKSLHQTVCFL